MTVAWLLLVVVFGTMCDISCGRGVNLGLCDDTHFTCTCGQSDFQVRLKIKRCSYTYRWKVRCKPCNDLKPEDVCPRYRLCEQCHLDGGNSCVTCPNGKFGNWCENTCTCQNGATCERNGKCICQPSYEGRNCENKKGCGPLPGLSPPLQVTLQPPDHPVTAVYSCPPDFVLSGQAISTCVSGKWSSGAPTCRPKCAILSAPANGRLVFSGNDLVEGVSAEVECSQGYRLVGQKILTCLAGGKWNHELPLCEELATCPDPGDVNHAERNVMSGSTKIGGHFLQDSKIQYMCKAGFEQMGVTKILCTFDGSWSNRLPTCIKVATIVPDCFTSGSDVIAEEGIPVRIMCPPECVDEEFKLWGTSIYRARSSVCQAAIHSAKITNSGGSVAIINNGNYSHFTGSDSNYIESESYPDRDESFRFDRLKPQPLTSNSDECARGLTKLENTCVYVSNLRRTYEEAKAVCANLGLYLEIPEDTDDRHRLITMLGAKGIQAIWADDNFQRLLESDENVSTRDKFSCPVAVLGDLNFRLENRRCKEFLNYACIKKTDAANLAVCRNPGQLENGKAQPVGQIDGVFYVGSSIEYACNAQHYLKGEKTISCTTNGTWSNSKPVCIKVDACTDAPVPIGGFVTYLPPLKSVSAQRSAISTSRSNLRAARLPVGLAAPIPANLPASSTAEPITMSLQPGLHRVGTRAMFDCESRYYKLIGSRTRRCQDMGEWSGRPPTCMPVCGRSDSPRAPFIVNGNATDIGQWPWQAGIARYVQDYNRWFLLCGASLINELWAITAAHCVTYAGTTLTMEPNIFQIYLGKYHRLDSKDDEYVQVRKIQEIHIHPDYDPGLFDADIALILLDSPIQLNSRVQPICLPTEQTTRENIVEGKRGVVTGWGMNENETYSETLQQAVLPVVSQANCEKGYEESELPLTVTENMFCAGYKQGRSDACSGDSGGPIVFLDESSKERRWVLEGIVSWGSPRGCGNPNQYGGFTTVSRFLDWIHLYF
uniref:Limulus clotting factor C-like n=1 Tax=Hasarius adansoni TaxID=243517 RepID=A0A0E4B921_9ARAC|nr:limulus clotting factor C-like [Hasarius adansoni]